MEDIEKNFPEIISLYKTFNSEKTENSSYDIGYAITSSSQSIENKKNYFKKLFEQVIPYSTNDAILNMWAVGAMLNDPETDVVNKISAFRGLFENEELPIKMLNGMIFYIWSQKRAPEDLLDFLEMDIRHSNKISKKVKDKICK